MQELGTNTELATNICTTDYPTMITDSRDGQIYSIQRLKDGNCWMTQNLKLGKNTTSLELTADDSDVDPSGFILTNKSSDGKFTNAGNNNNDNSQYYCTEDYGCYYNWYTSTSGLGTTYTTSGNVNYSICPKGWTLPTNLQLSSLYSSYGSPTNMLVETPTMTKENINGQSSPGFLLGGFYNTSGTRVGTYGYYWSRTAYNAKGVYNIYITTSKADPLNTSDNKFTGLPVRCLMMNPLEKAKTMQNLTATDVAKATDGMTAVLTDTRDNQQYSVAKINGNVWMTRNLAIGCNGSGLAYGSSVSSKTLTSATSNTNKDWATPTASLTNGNNYTTPYMTCNSTYGAWYNYSAASTGSITGEENGADGEYDVCPRGWSLPTYDHIMSVIGYAKEFNPVAGGRYINNAINNTQYGYWWGSSAANVASHHYLYYDGNSLINSGAARTLGMYLRCIKSAS